MHQFGHSFVYIGWPFVKLAAMKIRFTLLVVVLALVLVPSAARAQINAFGISLEISGNTVLVGQPAPEGGTGMVHLFQRSIDGESWEVVGQLAASDGQSGDLFGYSIVASEERLFIGAPSETPGAGAVYVFDPDGAGGWSEAAKLTAGPEDNIGGSLAAEGSLVASSGLRGGSHVSVFTLGDAGWEHSASLAADDTQDGDHFGLGLAVGMGTVFVGAPGHGGGNGNVYAFKPGADGWSGSSVLSGTGGGMLGVTIETAGSLLLVGAPGVAPNIPPAGPPPSGKVIVASQDGEIMQEIQHETENPDLFGFAIAVSGHQLLIGKPIANGQSGAVHSYTLNDASQWEHSGSLDGEGQEQLLGLVVAAAGSMGFASAPATNFGSGKVVSFAIDSASGELTRASNVSATPEPEALVASGMAECSEGAAGQFGCSGVDLLAFMPLEDLGTGEGEHANDIWGWTDPTTDREYALVGRSDGTAFVDITEPSSPMLIGSLALTEGARTSAWRDIKVYQDHAYIVADGAGQHGMQVFDLTFLREPADAPRTFEAVSLYDQIGSAHNIVINEDTGFAYAVGVNSGGESCGGGLHMINIQDPANPEFAGCFADTSTGRAGTGYSHDAQCVIYSGPDADHTGKEICFNSNETALSISDVTDKENTVALSSASYPNVAYAHQGWLTDDQAYFYMNDELDELQGEIVGTRTMIWDVSDLDDPQLVGEHSSENLSSDHNLYILDNLMYQSNYLSGLRVLDISDPGNPVEVGFFDTVPHGDDKPGFGGSWSNYPYFNSGSIVVSSMNEGLFIVRRRSLDL